MLTSRNENVVNRIALSLAAAAVLAVAGCGSEDPAPPPPAAKTSLGTAAAGDLTVELLTDRALETGMTPIYVKVTDATGQVVTDATVAFIPMMSMGMTGHSAPVIGPAAPDADGLHRFDVVFQMAGSWSATVDVTPTGLGKVTASFAALTVTDSYRAARLTYTDPVTGVTKYVMSLNFAATPRMGVNSIVVTLHCSQDGGMTFVPADGTHAIHLLADMPAMPGEHPSSADPAPVSPGVYGGELGFVMTGDWTATATVRKGDVEIWTPSPVFPFTVY